MALSTFLVHTLALKRPLTAAAGFAALSLFDLLRFPLVVLPDMINYCSKALVSFGRIEAFLEREEVEGSTTTSTTTTAAADAAAAAAASSSVSRGPALVIRDGAFRWGGSGAGAAMDGGGDDGHAAVPPTLRGALCVVGYD